MQNSPILSIEETPTGEFVLLEMRPVQIGSFVDRSAAELIAEAMRKSGASVIFGGPAAAPALPAPVGTVSPEPEALAELVPAPVTAKAPKGDPVPLQPKVPTAQLPVPAPRPRPAAKPRVQPAPEPEAEDPPWTVAELTEALPMLREGKSVKEVAAHFGKSWTSLRAKWASAKRLGKDQEVEEQFEKQDCAMCGRTYLPGPDTLDICSRCAND